MNDVINRLRLFSQTTGKIEFNGYREEILDAFVSELEQSIPPEIIRSEQDSALWLVLLNWIRWMNAGTEPEQRIAVLSKCVCIDVSKAYCTPPEELLKEELEEESSNVVPLWK